ncbi:MAG TPA: 3-hydroxyacyl-CoA dehydrogenase NAD-binding domain-containing protein [Alphaproteobacteria bacterium]|nr:3-hydroxyacyl-CoA dehydrogenase NAD-binding domain-containing protein [Alphaproteobacteria bacterium]
MGASGIQKVGVVGIGLMGSGIAQVAATCGFDTIVTDTSEELVKRGMARIEDSLTKLVASYERSKGQRGMSAEQRRATLEKLQGTSDLKRLLDGDIIIEAVTENYAVKANLYQDLVRLGYRRLLASNTSSISITHLAANYSLPEKFMGLHFMNPVPIQPGVEVIRGLLTSDDTARVCTAFAQELGKVPIPAEDKAGFGINRMFVPYLNEAVKVIEEGIMSVEDADKTTLCLGHKMGPLSTLDYVGLDTALAVAEVLEAELGAAYKPAPLLKRLVQAGCYGMKNGKGFYVYEEGKPPVVNPAVARYRIK